MNPRTPYSAGLRASALAVALAATGCTEAREAEAPAPTWQTGIATLVQDACVDCHGAERADGSYRLDSYEAVLGVGTDDVPNAIAGDESSRFLTALGEMSHDTVSLSEEDEAMLRAWVGAGRLAYFDSLVHPPGFVNPADAEFHGAAIRHAGWAMGECASCHGADFTGASSGPTCRTCHERGPTACDVCHGADGDPMPGRVTSPSHFAGAHAAHVNGEKLGKPVACTECHVVPETVDAAGHLDRDGHADVIFGAQAKARGALPSYDHTTGTCSNVACHGAGLESGTVASPEWGGGGPAALCGSCHGVPPRGLDATRPHAQSMACQLCHASAAEGPDGAPVIVDVSTHMDGTIQLREGVDRCDSCHFGPESELPFRDLQGRTDVTLRTVGAHDAHLVSGTFAGPVPCSGCHTVPASLGVDGHVDPSPAELVLAGGGAFDEASSTCSAKCHGVGMSGGPAASPSWTGPRAGFLCGSCHAIPPATTAAGEPHPPDMTCGTCHGAVIDDQWQWVDRSRHVNGTVEVVTP